MPVATLATGTFSSLIEKLWVLQGDARRIVSSVVRRHFLEELMQGTAKSYLPEFLQSSGGLELFESLAQLYSLDDTFPALGRIDSQFVAFFRAYEQLLSAQGFIEEHQAVDVLAAEGQGICFTLVCMDFASFTPAQYKLLLSLAKLNSVQVFVTMRSENAGFDEASRCIDYLCNCGAKLTKISDSPPSNTAPLTNLEKIRTTLFAKEGPSQTAPIHSVDNSLSFAFARGEEAEVALVGKAAQEAWEAQHSAAILCRGLKAKLPLLVRELEQRRIPFEVDERLPLGSSGFGAALLALLRVCVDDDCVAAAAMFASSVYSGLDAREANDLDTTWRARNCGPKRILYDLAQTKGSRRVDAIDVLHPRATARQWVNLVTELYGNGLGKGEMSPAQVLQDAAAHKTIIDALSDLAELRYHAAGEASKNTVISAAELLTALRNAVISQTPRPASSALLLSEPQRVRGRHFDTAIICGLDEQGFRFETEDPLRLRLARRLGWDRTPVSSGEEGMRSYCAGLLETADKQLILTATVQELSGETRPPSPFLDAILACFGVNSEKNLMGQEAVAALCPTLCYPEDLDETPVTSRPYTTVAHGSPDTYDFGFTSDSVFSASDLEVWARCPYLWFLTRFASSAELDTTLDLRQEGSLAHTIMQRFYETLPAKLGAHRVVPDNLSEAQELLRDLAEDAIDELRRDRNLSAGDVLGLDVLTEKLCEFLTDEAHFAPLFIPQAFEVEFGRGDAPPAQLTGGEEGAAPLHVKGFIDRIDASADGQLLVIDYKLSSTPGGLERQANNQYFQGIIYEEAAEQLLDGNALGHVYRSLKRPSDQKQKSVVYDPAVNADNCYELPKIRLSSAQYQSFRENLLHDIRAAAAGLVSGELRLGEKNNPGCTYCPWADCPNAPAKRWKR